MKYDIASKIVIDIGKEAILRRFLKMDPDSIQLLEELSIETFSLRRSDFPLRVVFKNRQELIVLIEIQTDFNQDFILRLIDYRVRFQLKYHLEVIPLVLLLTPSTLATGHYRDKFLTFRYNVVCFQNENPEDYLNELSLYPFLPLMKDGEKYLEKAEITIYENTEIGLVEKGDMLTAMAIFAGLKNKDLATHLIRRRRDIMRQSVAYEIIKEEGLKEGMQQGIQQGIQQGMQQGIQQGMQQGMQQLLLDALEIKFEAIPLRLIEALKEITGTETLKILHRYVIKCNSIEEFENKMKLMLEG